MKKLISVIVPIYNVEKYLRKCLESIINQTYRNLDIILVDDGSKDNCATICKEYMEKDERIRYLYKENGGQASARNFGIDHAKGQYVSFIDPDDTIATNFYEYLLNLSLTYDADIAQCNFVKLYEGKEDEKYDDNLDHEEITITDNIGSLRRLYSYDFDIYFNTIITCNKLYKRSVFDEIRYSTVRIYEELGTVYKFLYQCKKLIASNAVLYRYLQRGDSTLKRPFSMERLFMLNKIQENITFFEKEELYDLQLAGMRKYIETVNRFIYMIHDGQLEVIDKEYIDRELEQSYYGMCDQIEKFFEKHEEYHFRKGIFEELYNQYQIATQFKLDKEKIG